MPPLPTSGRWGGGERSRWAIASIPAARPNRYLCASIARAPKRWRVVEGAPSDQDARPSRYSRPNIQGPTYAPGKGRATPLVSSGGAGGGCDTVLSLGRELGAVSLMIVVSRSTLRPPQAGRTISTVVAKKRRHSVIRLMACFSLTLLYCSHSVSSLLFLYIGAADSRL